MRDGMVSARAVEEATTSNAGSPRIALVLGAIGSLGEELVEQLVASPDYSWVQVGLRHSIGSASPRYRPWVIGSSMIVADDAFVCVTDDTAAQTPSPVERMGPADVVRAATIARDAGVRRLIVVAPLATLLQLGESAQFIADRDELELTEMGFATLVIVRPILADAAPKGDFLARVMHAIGRLIFDIVLPPRLQPLRARTAAAAILAFIERARPGIHVLGARELMAIVEETMPGSSPKKVRLR